MARLYGGDAAIPGDSGDRGGATVVEARGICWDGGLCGNDGGGASSSETSGV